MLVTYIQYNEKDKILGTFNDEPRKGYYPLLISLKFPSERRRVTGSYRRQTDKMWTVQKGPTPSQLNKMSHITVSCTNSVDTVDFV